MERQRILIAEDDAPMRARLEDALAADPALEVALSTGTLAEALAGLRRIVPDVLLVDLGLPDGSGLWLIREARQLMADAQILVVTVFGDEKSVIAAIEAGARGYLLKDSEPSDVCQAVRQLLTGGAPISPAIARHLLRRFQEPARVRDAASASRPAGTAGELPHLSKREIEVRAPEGAAGSVAVDRPSKLLGTLTRSGRWKCCATGSRMRPPEPTSSPFTKTAAFMFSSGSRIPSGSPETGSGGSSKRYHAQPPRSGRRSRQRSGSETSCQPAASSGGGAGSGCPSSLADRGGPTSRKRARSRRTSPSGGSIGVQALAAQSASTSAIA